MNQFKKILFILLIFLAISSRVYAKCETDQVIQIAEMDWPSAGVLAHISDQILRNGLECNTKLIPGSALPLASSMLSKGVPHIIPELWLGSIEKLWNTMTKKNIAYQANDIFSEGPVEGWWIPDYVAQKNPKLKSISDLKNYAHLFEEPGTKGKGRFYGCPPGWACEVINYNLFKALKIEDHYELFSPGSGANLDATIARKFAQKKPILVYYWGPTSILGKYNLVRLQMPPYEEPKWQCLIDKDCLNPQASGWIKGKVIVAAISKIKKFQEIDRFLNRFQIPNKVLSSVLSWTDKYSANNEEAANYFLKNYSQVWTKWLVGNQIAIEKIKKSIK